MKRACLSVGLALLILALLAVPVMAVYYVWITVTESDGNSYTELAMNLTMDIDTLADEGYIAANGTDTRVTDPDYNVLPHMLADDRLMWTGNLTGNASTQFIFWADQTPVTSFPIIAGHGGYVTINDTADIEPGDMYSFQIGAYFDTAAGTNKTIIRKDGAVVFNVTAYQQLTFAVTGGNSLLITGVTPGYHFIGVYCDGDDMWAEVDSVLKDTDTASAIPNTANDWYLFEGDVCPYVYYYDSWKVTT
jgi:hypothetical protein